MRLYPPGSCLYSVCDYDKLKFVNLAIFCDLDEAIASLRFVADWMPINDNTWNGKGKNASKTHCLKILAEPISDFGLSSI